MRYLDNSSFILCGGGGTTISLSSWSKDVEHLATKFSLKMLGSTGNVEIVLTSLETTSGVSVAHDDEDEATVDVVVKSGTTRWYCCCWTGRFELTFPRKFLLFKNS